MYVPWVLLDEGNCVDNNKEIVVYLRRNWRIYKESGEKQARHFVSNNYVLDCAIKGLNRRESRCKIFKYNSSIESIKCNISSWFV